MLKEAVPYSHTKITFIKRHYINYVLRTNKDELSSQRFYFVRVGLTHKVKRFLCDSSHLCKESQLFQHPSYRGYLQNIINYNKHLFELKQSLMGQEWRRNSQP